ncbi:oligopeptidase B [Marinicella pacifica]|uniref:Oligopeptidase B n=1 Tax=Marinicella pacifica TaxID=1171543 RepID=A0A917FQJ8_9GAMM|nr:S9 family peptidase [Marinicella pacifica]GGF95040.1 oligopeptidase B [Marinicella pacifica]
MQQKFILLAFISLLSACQSTPTKELNMNLSKPPVAKKVPHTLTIHGDKRVDNYHWLRDDQRSNPDVLAYLEAENKYTEAQLKDVEPLAESLYREITARIKQNDESVPYQLGEYWYYSRYSEGQEYPIYARKKGQLAAPEQLLLDVNELAKDYAYYASNFQKPSPNHKIYGFSEDTVSRRQYDLRFKDLTSGQMLPDVIKNTTGSIAWAKDSETFFYTRKHPVTLLPYRVYRHRLGTPVSEDVLVYQEPDDTFYLSCYTSRSGDYIMIQIESTTQSEALYLDAANPTGEFASVLPREQKHEYSVEDYQGDWIIVTNWKALNSRVMRATIGDSQDKNRWQEIIPHDNETLIYDVEAFKDWLAVDQRHNGLKHIKVKNWTTGDEKIIQGEESVSTMWVGHNPEQNTNSMRYSYDSFTALDSIYEVDLNTDEKTLLKQDEINGPYNPDAYHAERLLITARDGAQVPVSLVYKKSDQALNERPLLVYGYGSYGHSIDPSFSVSRLSLLDRGFVYAVAHIRGSQAKGRAWYEDGKMFNKLNTFTDFIDASKALLDKGYGDPERMYAWGGSAGGLLMGAVANMAGDLYDGMIASVPFVDVVTTMLDESLPLTTGEFEEWGNPKNKDSYEYMLSYSPYDQVKAQDYPNILVTTGLHDSQVQYFEPAKWVAKLRDMKTDDNLLLMRTNMDTGHGGASGRFSYYKETAQDYAFLLKLAGIKQ